MEKLIINLIFDLDDKTSDAKLCNRLKRNIIKKKRRNLLLKIFLDKKRRIPKVLDYFKVIQKYPEDIFFDHFRMRRETFQVNIVLTCLEVFNKTLQHNFAEFATRTKAVLVYI